VKTLTSKIGLVALSLLTASIAATTSGCSSDQSDEDGSDDALEVRGTSQAGQWVVDLKAAASLYGTSSKYFFGIDGAELGGAQAGFPPGVVVWDQTFRFDSEHKAVDGAKEFPVVKDPSGKMIGPKGRFLNIIPLLKDTDPTKQAHLRKYLQNGDILMFFHPEQTTMRNAMDRRASHVAMHYDYKSPYSGKEFVHHVDNPNNYGPRYNYQPTTHMPFHVFRFKPKSMPAQQAANYALAARNWSFITDDLSPFADFYTLNLQKIGDLQRFRDAALAGQNIPPVYCSGLAFTNLNLGINFPLKASDIGSKRFARGETGETTDAQVLAPSATADLQGLNRLVFEPYTASELATVWLDNTYAHLPVPARQQLSRQKAIQDQVGSGFRALEFSDIDGKQSTGSPPQVANPDNMKAWGEAYALKAGDETAAFLARDDIKITGEDGRTLTIKDALALPENANIDRSLPASKILRELEIRHIKNRFVPPRIWADQSEARVWDSPDRDPRQEADSDIAYVGTVINCELLAASDGSAKDACKLDVDGVGAGSDEFSQGGADSSTYPQYAVGNGGERSHRRFDARSGPDAMGKGSKIVVRATASNIGDVRFLFHTPDMYAAPANEQLYSGGKWAQLSSLVDSKAYDNACTQIYTEAQNASRHGSCAPVEGIVLDPSAGAQAGPVDDKTFVFDLLKVCAIKDEKTMTCPVATQKSDGSGWDFANIQRKDVSRVVPKGDKPAYVDATMVDLGQSTDAQQLQLCPACPAGGAHFNQWTVTIRNDR
jgi:hypothetical protein